MNNFITSTLCINTINANTVQCFTGSYLATGELYSNYIYFFFPIYCLSHQTLDSNNVLSVRIPIHAHI